MNVVEQLRIATENLLYPSESDAPFEVIHWPGNHGVPRADKLLELLNEDSPFATEQSIEGFFNDLISYEDWHDKEERATADRFRALFELVQRELSDAKVFRIGGPNVSVYIVGRPRDGGWTALKTSSIET